MPICIRKRYWRPAVGLHRPKRWQSCRLSASVLLHNDTFLQTENKWSELHQQACELNWNPKDDHNLLSVLKPLSLFLKATTQRWDCPFTILQTYFFTSFTRHPSQSLSSSHWISKGLCFFPQGLNLYLFLLNISLF